MRIFRRNQVPARVQPIVRRLFEEMNEQCIGICDMADRAGISKHTIHEWRKRCNPTVVNIEACFNVLGLTLAVKRHKSQEEECP